MIKTRFFNQFELYDYLKKYIESILYNIVQLQVLREENNDRKKNKNMPDIAD